MIESLKSIVVPVGLPPTRFDIIVKNKAFCGYTRDKTEANAWKEGIQKVLDRSFELGRLFERNNNKKNMKGLTKTPIVWKGILFDSQEEMFFAFWLDELKEKGLVKSWIRSKQAIPLTPGLKTVYEKTINLKTKIKTQSKEHTILRPSEYTPDFEIYWTMDGAFYLVSFIKPVLNNPPKLFFTTYYDRPTFVEIKPGNFDPNNMERLFKNNQKFIWDKLKIFVNLVEPVELFKKTFLPSLAAPYFKYKVVPKKAKAKGKKVGDYKFDWKPKTITEFLNT